MLDLERQIQEAKSEAQNLKTRAEVAKATKQVNDTLSEINPSGAKSVLERQREKVLQMEAEAQGSATLIGENLDEQFKMLDTTSADDELALLMADDTDSAPAAALPAGESAPVNTEAEFDKLEADFSELDL